jgi:hypothetical protein
VTQTGTQANPQPSQLPQAGPTNPKSTFPADPNQFTKDIGVPPTKTSVTADGTRRMEWRPNENTKIRYESHPEGLQPMDPGYNPRHHGAHYHIETKPAGMSWSQAQKQGLVTKVKPDGYTPGSGTGLVPGEAQPGR